MRPLAWPLGNLRQKEIPFLRSPHLLKFIPFSFLFLLVLFTSGIIWNIVEYAAHKTIIDDIIAENEPETRNENGKMKYFIYIWRRASKPRWGPLLISKMLCKKKTAANDTRNDQTVFVWTMNRHFVTHWIHLFPIENRWVDSSSSLDLHFEYYKDSQIYE